MHLRSFSVFATPGHRPTPNNQISTLHVPGPHFAPYLPHAKFCVYVVIPIVFFVMFMTSATLVVEYTLCFHQQLPEKFVIAATVFFVLVIVFEVLGSCLVYTWTAREKRWADPQDVETNRVIYKVNSKGKPVAPGLGYPHVVQGSERQALSVSDIVGSNRSPKAPGLSQLLDNQDSFVRIGSISKGRPQGRTSHHSLSSRYRLQEIAQPPIRQSTLREVQNAAESLQRRHLREAPCMASSTITNHAPQSPEPSYQTLHSSRGRARSNAVSYSGLQVRYL